MENFPGVYQWSSLCENILMMNRLGPFHNLLSGFLKLLLKKIGKAGATGYVDCLSLASGSCVGAPVGFRTKPKRSCVVAFCLHYGFV